MYTICSVTQIVLDNFLQQSANEMQSKKADFTAGPPPGELDETYVLSSSLAYSRH